MVTIFWLCNRYRVYFTHEKKSIKFWPILVMQLTQSSFLLGAHGVHLDNGVTPPWSNLWSFRLITHLSLTRWFEVVDLHRAWFHSIGFNVRCENHNVSIQCLNWCSKDHVGYEERGAVWFYQRGESNMRAPGCDIGLLSVFTRPSSLSHDLSSPNIYDVGRYSTLTNFTLYTCGRFFFGQFPTTLIIPCSVCGTNSQNMHYFAKFEN